MPDKSVHLPPEDELGPKMRALKSVQHRAFVWAFANNGLNATEAAESAGYDKHVYQTGYRLKQRGDVQEAIHEVSGRMIQASAAMAVKALIDVVNDPSHKGHMKAIELLLDRGGFHAKSERIIKHDLTDEQIVAKIAALALRHKLPLEDLLGESRGLAKKFLPKPSKPPTPGDVVDAEYEEIDPELQELL